LTKLVGIVIMDNSPDAPKWALTAADVDGNSERNQLTTGERPCA